MYLSEFEYSSGRPMIRKDTLNTVKKYAKQTLDAGDIDEEEVRRLVSTLEKRGWRKVGGGFTSIALLHPKRQYVLKINFRPDPAYDEFVRIIHAHPNIHFPKISDATDIIKGKYPFSAYFMERLYPCTDPYAFRIAQILDTIITYPNTSMEDLIKEYPSRKDTLSSLPPDLILAAQILGNNRTNISSRLDLHSENIMVRADETVVITDPFINFKVSGFEI